MLDPRQTWAAALHSMRREFARAGLDSPDRDARLLFSGILGIEPVTIIAASKTSIGENSTALSVALARRLAREPVSRILGRRGFYGRDFEVTPATLDPRPESETVVEAALALAAEEGWRSAPPPPLDILDVGTGSGCLLVTLLAELLHATGLGTDISGTALTVADRNARCHGLDGRVRFAAADVLCGVSGEFQLIVSNPPYVRSGDIAGLAPEVRCFDPHIALDGGADGLAVYRAIAAGISRYISNGWIILEVAAEEAAEVARLVRRGLGGRVAESRTYRDLSGSVRCVAVKARK